MKLYNIFIVIKSRKYLLPALITTYKYVFKAENFYLCIRKKRFKNQLLFPN